MIPFQMITLFILGAVIVWELVRLVRGRVPWRWALVRLLVWSAAAVSIAYPLLLQHLALAIGIHRGADLVVYLFALAFLATTFFLVSHHLKLQRQLTELVRHLALLEAKRGEPPHDDTRNAN